MAIRTGKFIIGSLDNLVFKARKGKQILQSAPGKGGVKQTKATKKAAGLFGKASTLGWIIRSDAMFSRLIFDLYDGSMVNRLTKTLRIILEESFDKKNETFSFKEDSFARLTGFDFNLNSPFKETMRLTPEATLAEGMLVVTLPEIKITEGFKFPESTDSCSIHIKVRSFNLHEGLKSERYDDRKLEIRASQPLLEKQALSFPVPDGCLCLAAIALRFYGMKYEQTTMYNTKAFSPSGILGAFITPGDFKNEKKRGGKKHVGIC